MRDAVRTLAVLLALLFAPTAGAAHVVQDFEKEVIWGCARRDCIPSIDEPSFDDGAWLDAGDRVLGIEIDGDARAYAVRILNWHEIVNDLVGGAPVVVTYCPLCGTGLTFERTISTGVTEFGVSGRLYKNDLVMYDRATESFWSQELGEAIWGDLHAERLGFVPTATTTWGEWREAHPDTKVLARPSTYPAWRYDDYPYGDYEESDRTLFPVENPSNTLHPKEWVLGVFTDNESVAFRKADVQEHGEIREPVDGRVLLVRWQEGSPRATWEGDDATSPPRQVLGFWFAWHDFHPDTRLWGRLLADVIPGRGSDAPTRVVFSEEVVAEKVGAHVPAEVAATWPDPRVLELRGNTTFTIPAGAYGRNGTSLQEALVIPLGEAPPSYNVPFWGAGALFLLVFALALLRRR